MGAGTGRILYAFLQPVPARRVTGYPQVDLRVIHGCSHTSYHQEGKPTHLEIPPCEAFRFSHGTGHGCPSIATTSASSELSTSPDTPAASRVMNLACVHRIRPCKRPCMVPLWCCRATRLLFLPRQGVSQKPRGNSGKGVAGGSWRGRCRTIAHPSRVRRCAGVRWCETGTLTKASVHNTVSERRVLASILILRMVYAHRP